MARSAGVENYGKVDPRIVRCRPEKGRRMRARSTDFRVPDNQRQCLGRMKTDASIAALLSLSAINNGSLSWDSQNSVKIR